jgi:hypothetical protein
VKSAKIRPQEINVLEARGRRRGAYQGRMSIQFDPELRRKNIAAEENIASLEKANY